MIGIMAAMPEEIDRLVAEMGPAAETISAGMRTYHRGRLWGTPAVLVFSRWGKVSAATTSTHLISDLKVTRILFSGVAGAVDPDLRIGDVVIAKELYQHDMDARPLFQRHEIPLLNMMAFPTNIELREALTRASRRFLMDQINSEIPEPVRTRFKIISPKAIVKDIASGDKFFASKKEISALRDRMPVACVEMEGAAVAQVCYEHSVPLGVIRTVSDAADEGAPIEFSAFVREVASVYSHGIIKNFLQDQGSG